jgi:hypothetical protein
MRCEGEGHAQVEFSCRDVEQFERYFRDETIKTYIRDERIEVYLRDKDDPTPRAGAVTGLGTDKPLQLLSFSWQCGTLQGVISGNRTVRCQDPLQSDYEVARVCHFTSPHRSTTYANQSK